eukprot:3657477-Prymnesium_polylepis.2
MARPGRGRELGGASEIGWRMVWHDAPASRPASGAQGLTPTQTARAPAPPPASDLADLAPSCCLDGRSRASRVPIWQALSCPPCPNMAGPQLPVDYSKYKRVRMLGVRGT